MVDMGKRASDMSDKAVDNAKNTGKEATRNKKVEERRNNQCW